MTDGDNVDEVNRDSGELLEAFDRFEAVRVAFHEELTDPLSVRESENYYDLASGQVDLLLENLEIWPTGYRTSNSLRHRVVSSLKTSQKSNEASFIISPSPLVKTTEEFLAFEKPMYIKITASL